MEGKTAQAGRQQDQRKAPDHRMVPTTTVCVGAYGPLGAASDIQSFCTFFSASRFDRPLSLSSRFFTKSTTQSLSM